MTAMLNFTICGKTEPFTALHTAEMDSAQKIHIEAIVTGSGVEYMTNHVSWDRTFNRRKISPATYKHAL